MQIINLVLRLDQELGGSWRYRQETPSRRELDVFSNLYLDKQALSGVTAPEMLHITVRPGSAASQPISTRSEGSGFESEVLVRLFERTGWTAHYKQEHLDPGLQRIIADPYVGIAAFDDQPLPDLLLMTIRSAPS